MEDKRRVCPAEKAGMLDNSLRRLIHPGVKLLSPYVNPGDHVLDLGCGPGSFTDTLAELAGEEGRVIAVDLQPRMLEVMNKKIAARGLSDRVVAHSCTADSLLLDDYRGSVDFALAFWMAHETPDLGSFLTQVYNALKTDGRLLCVEPFMHVSPQDYKEMISLGETLGFRTERIRGIAASRSVLYIK